MHPRHSHRKPTSKSTTPSPIGTKKPQRKLCADKTVKYRDETLTDCGEIFAIYVLADYYGQKVGYELMNAAFEKLAAYNHIAVWVLKGNERAIKFYERYGFRFDGTEQEIKLGTPNTELRMIYERD